MIGKNVITLDYNDFVRGMSTSDSTPDGGFSPTTDNVNLTYLPGVIYQPAATQPTGINRMAYYSVDRSGIGEDPYLEVITSVASTTLQSAFFLNFV